MQKILITIQHSFMTVKPLSKLGLEDYLFNLTMTLYRNLTHHNEL